jgi:peptide/nickel transport system substrate-binding protein
MKLNKNGKGGKIMEKSRTETENYRISQKDLEKVGKEMYRIIKCAFSLLLALVFGILLVHGGAVAGVKFRSSIEGDPVNLDPAHLHQTDDRVITQQVYEGLVAFDYTAKPPYPIIPVLAKSYEVSKDAKMITFKLHKGVQFHGGYGELTSEDVVFTLQRHREKKVASRARSQLADVERIEALDRYTARIYLRIPSAFSLIENLAWQNAGFILSKKAAAKLGDKIARIPIGTGPYYFDKWAPGEKVVLKKFDKYWGTPARIDEIEFWVVSEETVALGALEKGDLDLVPLTQTGSYERAKSIKGTYIAESLGGARVYLAYLNLKVKPMDDLRVRRALAHALDIKETCSRLGPLVEYFPSPLAPVVTAATDEFWRFEYDLAKAKQLLAEAGYPNGFELRFIYQKYGLLEPIVLELKNSWSKIVDVKLEMIERAIWSKTLRKYEHHVALWSSTKMAPYLFAERYQTGNKRNYSHYANPEVDAAIKKARTAKSEKEARKSWREFQRMVTEDVVNFWVANGKSLAAISSKVKGVVVTPYAGMVDLKKAYIE